MSINHVDLSTNKPLCVHFKQVDYKLGSPHVYLSVDSPLKLTQKNDSTTGTECHKCNYFQRIIELKDEAIRMLAEDRDDLKYKLTAITNKNIEMKQQLKKLSNELDQAHRYQNKSGNNTITLDKNDETYLKERCSQLEIENEHIKRHLNELRNIFEKDLQNSSGTTNNTTNTTNNTTTSSNQNKITTNTSTTLTSTALASGTTVDDLSNVQNITNTTFTVTSELESSFDKWYRKS